MAQLHTYLGHEVHIQRPENSAKRLVFVTGTLGLQLVPCFFWCLKCTYLENLPGTLFLAQLWLFLRVISWWEVTARAGWNFQVFGPFGQQKKINSCRNDGSNMVGSLHGGRGTGTVLKKRRSVKASKRQMATWHCFKFNNVFLSSFPFKSNGCDIMTLENRQFSASMKVWFLAPPFFLPSDQRGFSHKHWNKQRLGLTGWDFWWMR